MFQLTKEADRVYRLHFTRRYDLCMTFLRYQEFYESDNRRFQHRRFTLASYMRWYSEKKNAFSYPTDWSGFNMPVSIIDRVRAAGIEDPTHYDAMMYAVAQYIRDDSNNDDCYLIGTYEGDAPSTYTHEMAHGMFYTLPEYAEEVRRVVDSLSKELRTRLFNRIQERGYADSSVVDEIQAFLVDGGGLGFFWHEDEKAPEEFTRLVSDLRELNRRHLPAS